jgi:hypothetical protein
MSQEALSFVGKEVECRGNNINIRDEKHGPFFFEHDKQPEVYASLIQSARRDIEDCLTTNDSTIG